MLKKIGVFVLVLSISILSIIGLVGCNGQTSDSNGEDKVVDNSVYFEDYSNLTTLDNGIKLASSDFVVNSDGTLSSTVTANVYPVRLNSTQVNWNLGLADTTSEANFSAVYVGLGYEHPSELVELRSTEDNHVVEIVVKHGFSTLDYKLTCTTVSTPSVSTDILVKYDGAITKLLFDDEEVTSSSNLSFVYTEGESYEYELSYSNYFDQIGQDYATIDQSVVLDSVLSDVYMGFEYIKGNEVGFIALRLDAYYTEFIDCNLDFLEDMTPVSSGKITMSVIKSPDNFSTEIDGGTVSNFYGYFTCDETADYFVYYSKLGHTSVAHEDAYINYVMHDHVMGAFTIKVRIEPIVSKVELDVSEIVV